MLHSSGEAGLLIEVQQQVLALEREELFAHHRLRLCARQACSAHRAVSERQVCVCECACARVRKCACVCKCAGAGGGGFRQSTALELSSHVALRASDERLAGARRKAGEGGGRGAQTFEFEWQQADAGSGNLAASMGEGTGFQGDPGRQLLDELHHVLVAFDWPPLPAGLQMWRAHGHFRHGTGCSSSTHTCDV